jgi:hypothetical protein
VGDGVGLGVGLGVTVAFAPGLAVMVGEPLAPTTGEVVGFATPRIGCEPCEPLLHAASVPASATDAAAQNANTVLSERFFTRASSNE